MVEISEKNEKKSMKAKKEKKEKKEAKEKKEKKEKKKKKEKKQKKEETSEKSEKKKLLKEIDVGNGEVTQIEVNQSFAKKYNEKKRKEELTKLQHLEKNNGLNYDDEDESDSESEDEVGDFLSKDLDSDITKTINMIRKKDPRIYNHSVAFFQEENSDEIESTATKEKEDKPVYYKDLIRKQVLEGDVENCSDDDEQSVVKTYREEQEEIRGDFLKSVNNEVSDDSDEDVDELDGGLFSVRKRSEKEIEEEENEFNEFLKSDKTKEIDPDTFLDQYVNSRGWIDKNELPSYNDVVGDNSVDDEEDANELEKAEEFEHSYNFRFEEEGGADIATFPRQIEGSMRRTDDKRKKARELKRERKALERQKKEEELRRLKNLKEIEVRSKIEKIENLMGTSSKSAHKNLQNYNVDDDFDPEEHDKRMSKIFDDEYYEEFDDKKPTWDDDDELLEGIEMEDDSNNDEDMVNDDNDDNDDNGDASQAEEVCNVVVEPESSNIISRSSAEEEKLRLEKQKYLDELYSLDYEDIIEGMPCRFKYRNVNQNSFGLNTKDILHAEESDLKQFVSLKRIAPYLDREYSVSRKKVKNFQSMVEKSRAKKKRQEVEDAPASTTSEIEEIVDHPLPNQMETHEGSENKSKKRKRKRNRKRKTKPNSDGSGQEDNDDETTRDKISEAPTGATEVIQDDGQVSKKKRKKMRKKNEKEQKSNLPKLSSSRLESYRLKPLK